MVSETTRSSAKAPSVKSGSRPLNGYSQQVHQRTIIRCTMELYGLYLGLSTGVVAKCGGLLIDNLRAPLFFCDFSRDRVISGPSSPDSGTTPCTMRCSIAGSQCGRSCCCTVYTYAKAAAIAKGRVRTCCTMYLYLLCETISSAHNSTVLIVDLRDTRFILLSTTK